MKIKSDYGKYPTLTGLIIKHRGEYNYDEIGFARNIDMLYKNKPDQFTGIVVAWNNGQETFIKECKRLRINIKIIEYN